MVLTKILALIAVTVQITESKLTVYGPEVLLDAFKDSSGEIQSTLANFGHIPYGQTLIGRVYYNASNPYGCDKGSGFSEDFTGDPDNVVSPIYLVELGRCSQVQQVRNIEKAGGALAIIIDSRNEDVSDVVLSDDGTGLGIRIPAMLINKQDGQKLKNYIIERQKKVEEGDKKAVQEYKSTALVAEFLVEVSDTNQVTANYWYTSSDDTSLDFIRNMASYIEPIIDEMDFQPRFVTWACPHCTPQFKEKNCVSEGKYCAMQHDNNIDLNGREILLEDLRQYCIFYFAEDESDDVVDEHYKHFTHLSERTAYFEYVKRAHSLCQNRITEDCSNTVMKALDIDPAGINKCVAGTFTGDDFSKDDNNVFEADLQEWQEFGHYIYPSLTVNSKTFRGRLTPDNVFEAVCAAFKDEPFKCREFQELRGIPIPKGQSLGINQRTLFLLIVALVLVNVFIIMAYRKYLQAEMEKDMKIQVSSAVSQYVALSKHPELQNISNATDEQ